MRGATPLPPENTQDTDHWLHTLTELDRELPDRMLDTGRAVASLAERGIVEATIREVMAAGGINSQRHVQQGMKDLAKARYLRRLNPDAPRSEAARYQMMIPPGFTRAGRARNILLRREEVRARIKAVGGSSEWPRWYQDAWLTHKRYKGSGKWDPYYWETWEEQPEPIIDVNGALVDTLTGEILSESGASAA